MNQILNDLEEFNDELMLDGEWTNSSYMFDPKKIEKFNSILEERA